MHTQGSDADLPKEDDAASPVVFDVAAPTPDEVRVALSEIIDPEIGLPIVDLGLIYEIKVDEAREIEVIYTLTSLGCPAGPVIDGQINDALSEIEGVAAYKTTIVFQPPWTPEKMSEDAQTALGII